MNTKEKTVKRIELAVLLGTVCAILLSMARFDAACDELRGNVLRLHILANSDSEADQQLKLKVRDGILSVSNGIFDGTKDLAEAEKTAEKECGHFRNEALKVIRENGYSYDVTVSVEDSFFETREYESFTLPAGVYKSLTVRIGKAEGKNWWCVVFPQICIPAASGASLSDSVGKEGTEIAENPGRFRIKFKTVEIFEDLRHKFSK